MLKISFRYTCISEDLGNFDETFESEQDETENHDDSLFFVDEYIDLENEENPQDVKPWVSTVPSKIAPVPNAALVKDEKNQSMNGK